MKQGYSLEGFLLAGAFGWVAFMILTIFALTTHWAIKFWWLTFLPWVIGR